MDIEAFKAGLARDGYTEVIERSMEPGLFVDEHTHPFDVRALVLEGSALIACGDERREVGPGDILELAADTVHTEQYGDAPYRFLVGKRTPAAGAGS